MKSAIHTKRKTDAIISIRQDNSEKRVIITNLNKAAEALTGYLAKELIDKNFDSILPARIKELLSGYLEFDDGDSDFAIVARRIPNFQILTKKGEMVVVSLKVFNLVSQGANFQEYELLMRDLTLISKISELKELIVSSENTITARDPQTGMPSINSVVYALDTSYNFLKQYNAIDVCFLLTKISNINYYSETYGEYVASEILGTLGTMMKKCCRAEDMVGYMGNGIIGVVLLDCNLESAKIVINRIKTKVDTAKVTMQNGQQVVLSLGIAYTQIKKGQEMLAMIDACDAGLIRLNSRGGEGLVQV